MKDAGCSNNETFSLHFCCDNWLDSFKLLKNWLLKETYSELLVILYSIFIAAGIFPLSLFTCSKADVQNGGWTEIEADGVMAS